MKPHWTVRTTDAWTLGAVVHEPPGEVIGDLLLLHAMMVDARAMDRPPGAGLASLLASRGFRVHRADLRGRGMSARGERGYTYDDLVYRDLPALVKGVGGTPWVVGHSLGGHVAAASWASHSVKLRGLVGLSANIWMQSTEPSRRRRALKRAGLMALRGFALAIDRIPARRLKMGPVDEAGAYGEDLARYWSGWTDHSGRDWWRGMAGLNGPLLMVNSDGDALMGHPVGAESWARVAPNVELMRIRHGDHGLSRAPDHMEIAVDARSRPIWNAVADWMLHA